MEQGEPALVKSMTGYGRGEAVVHGRSITVELRSVNNRYLDCNVRIPRLYLFAEESIKSRVQNTISRGKVDVFVTLDGAGAEEVRVSVNRPLAQQYANALQELAQLCGPTAYRITPETLSRFPEVLMAEKAEENVEEKAQDICRVLDLALADFDQMRSREGQRLEEDILSRARTIEELVGRVEERFAPSRCTEYTVEAGRPDTITGEKLSVLYRQGVQRVSVNPQTMQDAVLTAMGRAHTAADILRSFELVRASGIPCVNMDLIAGLPQDTPEGFRASLDQVLALGPENVTVHTLALKKGSRLMGDGTGEGPVLPAAEDVDAMLSYAWEPLRAHGQAPYYLYRQKYMSGSFENVGWARPGWESLYNICMMEELHTILSLGGGGVTKLVHPRTGRIERIANPKYPHEYVDSLEKLLRGKHQAADFLLQLRQGE